ncbi:Arc family DNA-binding protein [Sphingomonas sp. RB3P16]|uniref:Arc family DNA-binding protein n=1 Tax=Parasphingomonas frigoris TaxID=3096163 RepID=UPI002FC5DBBC
MSREPTEVVQLKLRFREELRISLEEAAERAGRSLNSEIVARLERTFREDEAMGGADQADVVGVIVHLMSAASESVGTAWHQDHTAWEYVKSTVGLLMSALQPDPLPTLEDLVSHDGLEIIKRWENELGLEQRVGHMQAREAEDLMLKERVIGRLSRIERKRLNELLENPPRATPLPDMSDADMEGWQQFLRQEQVGSRVWGRLMPIVGMAMARFGKAP